MSAKAVVYSGLGGMARRESTEYEAALNGAFNAGRDARIVGKSLQGALKNVPQHLRREWVKGFNSICK